MKIAIVACNLELAGGQSIQARILVDGLRSEGHDITFVPINPDFPRGLRWVRRVRYLRTVVNEILYLPSLVKLRNVDVVHVFSASYWSFLLASVPAMVAGFCFRKRVVLNYHSGEAEDHLSRWGILVHPWLRIPHRIVVPSDYLADIFSRRGYRVEVIRNVVDVARFAYRERIPLRPCILSMRNLEPHYRVDVLIRAFSILKRRYPEATLLIAGEGSQAGKLRTLAASTGLDGISFVGRIEPDSVPEIYDRADIFVNPAVIDNQPVSILEAFAAGLPVVTTGTGDIPAMVRNGEAGVIVPGNEPTAIAKAIEDLLEDPSLARSVARCAREEALRYTWPSTYRKWATVYER